MKFIFNYIVKAYFTHRIIALNDHLKTKYKKVNELILSFLVDYLIE